MRKNLKIAFIPGDGVGPELVEQMIQLIKALNKKLGLKIEYKILPYSAEYYLQNNIVIPEDRLSELKQNYHLLLIGPLGDSRIPNAINARKLIYKIRQFYNLNIAIQHVNYYHESIMPLKEIPNDNYNFYILRENLEGFNHHFTKECSDIEFLNISDESNIYTRKNLEDFFNSSFQYVSNLGRNKINLALKKYYFPKTNKLWKEIFNKTAREFSDIDCRIISTETAEYYLLNNPALFDVLIAPDIFADQLMALGTFLLGGFGMSYYFNFGPDGMPVYRILHKPAHKYKGSDQANPIGTIRALEHAFRHFNMQKYANILDNSVRNLFESNKATIDLGGLLGTQETVDHILTYIEKL